MSVPQRPLPLNLYLFEDGWESFALRLQSLLRVDSDPLLQAFLSDAYLALRSEVGRLSQVERERFKQFSSLQDLLDKHIDGAVDASLYPALACICQVGTFIRLQNEDGRPYPGPSDTYILGVGIGSFAAVAVSCSRTVVELAQTALDAVRLAFLTSLHVCRVQNSIEVSTSLASWSMRISPMSVEHARKTLADFSRKNPLPPASQVYISAIDEESTIFSGPPQVLSSFKESLSSKHSVYAENSYGPYHAPHLFSSHDTSLLLKRLQPSKPEQVRELPLLFGSSGRLTSSDRLVDLFESALGDILINPVNWQDLAYGAAYAARFSPSSQINFVSLGNANERFAAAVSSKGCKLSNDIGNQAPPTPRITDPSSGRPKIAVIGMSGRFPEAENLAEFWDILLHGKDVHKEVPASRWNVATHFDPTGKGKNTSGTPFGCWLQNPGHFDTKFFNMSPREAPQVDPASRIALMTAYEAMEQAGMVPGSTPSTMHDRVGVFYGVSSNDWMEANSSQNIDTYFIAGGCRAFIPGRVNYFFKFSGPSFSFDTACSSSLSATHTACNALWQRDIDTAIVGGTNVLTNPDYTAGLDRGHFLSRTGNCKTFDDNADGYCRGEAVATLILKRLDDAIADKDPILGLIAGAFTNHSAEAESITRPHIGAQKSIIKKILHSANVDSRAVSYAEMHGTGTQAGDPVEMNSVLETLASTSPARLRDQDQPLYLGSVKSNVGHGEGAAGATSLTKVLLMMKQNTIPPHCGIKTQINHKYPKDLHQRGVRIAKEAQPWIRPEGGSRRAFVNNFSAAGGNSTILLEDAPPVVPLSGTDPRTSHVVTVSAKTASSLERNVQSLLEFIEEQPSEHDLSLSTLSYTTTARRMHHQFRVAVDGANLDSIKSALKQLSFEKMLPIRADSPPKVVFAFTGNGSQYCGMGKQLYETVPSFRDDLHRLDHLARKQSFPSIIPLCEVSHGKLDDYSPCIIQLATLCLEIALARLLIAWGISPSATMGHSLGEYAALAVAGVLSESDAMYLVGARAQLLEQKCTANTHAMLAVKASKEAISRSLTGKQYEVSCINSDQDTVLGSTKERIRQAQDTLKRRQIRSTLLEVPFAFHTSQVDPILDEFEKIARQVKFRKPTIPVLCPLKKSVVSDSTTFTARYLRDHARFAVDMASALKAAANAGLITDKSFVVELGPSPIFASMVKGCTNSPPTVLGTLKRNQDTWPVLTQTMSSLHRAGTNVNWAEYHSSFPSSHKVLQLPAYQWDLKNYWIQYVNDWSLRKGEPATSATQSPAALPSPKPAAPELRLTASIHKVVSDNRTEKDHEIVVQTDLQRKELDEIVHGHRVNGIPLCTPSLYAEIALTISSHVRDSHAAIQNQIARIKDMTIEKALVANENAPSQLLRTTARFDLRSKRLSCKFATVNDQGSSVAEHSSCTIEFATEGDIKKPLESPSKSARARLTSLDNAVLAGSAFRFNRHMIYRMVSGVATFDPSYERVDSLILDNNAMDASSRVTLEDDKPPSKFFCHPIWLDLLSQSAGFIMNGNDHSNLSEQVFVNHGWRGMCLFEKLVTGKTYETYVKMNETEGKRWEGDLLVLDGSKIVASFEGITLQGLSRRALDFVLRDATRSKVPPKPLQIARTTSEETITAPQPIRKVVSHHETVIERLASADEPSSPIISKTIHVRKKIEEQAEPSSPIVSKTIHLHKEIAERTHQPNSRLVEIAQDTEQQKAAEELASKVLAIICEESGVLESEMTDDAQFADLGIDSLLSLMIISRLREELPEVAFESTMFVDCPTVAALKGLFAKDKGSEIQIEIDRALDTHSPDSFTGDFLSPPMADAMRSTAAPSEVSCSSPEPEPLSFIKRSTKPVPAATSVILQGRPRSSPRILMLFPDGSGSATSYANLATGRSDLCIIGLNSPYYRKPEDFDCALDDLMESYLTELRRRQPYGPYNLGGWSSGGILAYRAAQILVQEGEEVQSLVLIDSPAPNNGLDRLPQRWYDFVESAGVFQNMSASPQKQNLKGKQDDSHSWLIPHFRASIEVLHDFHPMPLPTGFTPKVTVVWAAKSICEGSNIPEFQPKAGEPQGVRFLTETRTDFSAGEWALLFPGEEAAVEVIRGADHFSMMGPNHAAEMAALLDEATR